MAAQAATMFMSGRGPARRIEERNARLFAEQQRLRRGPTLEFNFPKRIDNSRLVKAPDLARIHEMRVFAAALVILFTAVMAYGWQHYVAIEKGYSVEASKQQLDQLREANRQLRLEEAQLSQPARIDAMARQMGMVELEPNQVVRGGQPVASDAPVLAQAQVAPALPLR